MNNKRYFNWQLAILALLVSLSISCTDNFFDASIDGRITPEQHYNSLKDAELSRDGCFVFLQDIAENLVLVDGLLSDEMMVTNYADYDMVAINLHELDATNQYIDPSPYYKLIINVNEVLPNLPQILEKDRDFDSITLEAFTGSLITLRCWAYFTLARINGEVGLVDGNLSTIDPSKPPVYLSKSEIIDKLIAELLPFYDEEDINRYPLDQYALLGELYLEKGDYTNAVKYLKFACDGPSVGKKYKVDGEYAEENWFFLFYNSAEQENAVFTAVPYNYEQGQMNKLQYWMNYTFMVMPSTGLVNSFKNEIQGDNETLGDAYRGYGNSYYLTDDSIPFIIKYSLSSGVPYGSDIILYRDADIHLLLAEALNRLGQTENALALLNNGFSAMASRPPAFVKWSKNIGVRGRVYLAPKTATDMLEIEDLIIQERAKELAFEGKRWFDLVRIAERRGDPAYLANKVAAKFDDPDVAASIKSKLMDPSSWYLPIPKVGGK